MDKILLQNMAFYGYHGVLHEENSIGQKFFVDMELFLDLKQAGLTDELDKSISYADVFNLVKNIVENEKFKLLEALAESISGTILSKYNNLDKIMVRIRKPEAPVPGIFDYFGVEIIRER